MIFFDENLFWFGMTYILFEFQQIDSGNGSPSKSEQSTLIEEIDVQKYLVFKKEGEDGPDVKGGELEALIVHATKVQKISENGKPNPVHLLN